MSTYTRRNHKFEQELQLKADTRVLRCLAMARLAKEVSDVLTKEQRAFVISALQALQNRTGNELVIENSGEELSISSRNALLVLVAANDISVLIRHFERGA